MSRKEGDPEPRNTLQAKDPSQTQNQLKPKLIEDPGPTPEDSLNKIMINDTLSHVQSPETHPRSKTHLRPRTIPRRHPEKDPVRWASPTRVEPD
jgi:hypothetical protein